MSMPNPRQIMLQTGLFGGNIVESLAMNPKVNVRTISLMRMDGRQEMPTWSKSNCAASIMIPLNLFLKEAKR
jgi:hypothetical protein